MNKQEFLTQLRGALSGVPQDDIEERLAFFNEMIDDRIEEGKTEEEAVAEAGPIGDIVSQTVAEVPLTKLMKERMNAKRSPRAWEIVLIVLGFPLWFPLLVAAAAVVFSLYIVLWSLVVSLWAVEFSLWISAVGALAGAVVRLVRGDTASGILTLGAALLAAGLSVFLFFGCAAATKGLVRLTARAARGLKQRIVGKEKTK